MSAVTLWMLDQVLQNGKEGLLLKGALLMMQIFHCLTISKLNKGTNKEGNVFQTSGMWEDTLTITYMHTCGAVRVGAICVKQQD